MEGRATVEVLGGLRIAVGDRRLEGGLPGRQGRALALFLLLREGRPATREELVDAVWPGGTAPPAARDALSALLSRLRRALAPVAIEGREAILLRLPPGSALDLATARADLAAARAALVARDGAAALVCAERAAAVAARGVVLDHPGDWVEDLRRDVAQIELDARALEASAALALGGPQLPRAVAAARAVVARSPFSEEATRLLMRALLAQGEVGEALRAYDELRRLLRDELAAAPSEALRAEHARLLAASATRPEAPDGRPFAPRALLGAPRGPFVGRARERAALLAAWERARGGELRVVLLGGEPGVGKTRLAHEAARAAHRAGAAVLLGRSTLEPLGAFQPWLEALGAWAEAATPPEIEAHVAPELSRLLPELAPRLPPAPPADPSLERLRLLDAAARTLRSLAGASGLLLVLDDLHWADPSSLELLRHLVRGPKDVPLLVIATTREDESPRLLDLAADVAREGVGERLGLGGLEEEEVADLVRALSGEPAPPRLARVVHERTGGNPFFVGELVRAGTPTGVPAAVRDVVAQRLVRLSAPLGDTLRAAAVIGRDASFSLLETVTELDPDPLLDALEEGVAAHVLVERPGTDGCYGFAHALVRAAIEAGMSGVRRRRLHLRVLLALEARHARGEEVAPAELARHALAAGDRDRAVEWSVRAAERAQARTAHEDAMGHYARARAVLGDRAPEQRLELELREGEAAVRAGHKASAHARFAAGAALARGLGRPDALARAALGFAGRETENFGRVPEREVALLREALAALPEEDSVPRAEVLARLGEALYFGPSREESEQASAEGLAMIRRLDAPRALARILGERHYTLWRPDRFEERLALSAELLERAQALGDGETLCQAWSLRLIDLLELGDFEAADAGIAAHREHAHALHQPHFLLYAAVLRAMAALRAGDLEAGERLAFDALTIGQRDQDPDTLQFFAVQLFALRAEQGRLPELEEPVREFVAQYPAIPAWRAALAHVLVEAGQLEAAREEVARLGAGERVPLDVNWLTGMALLAHAVAALEDAAGAAALHARLEPYRSRTVFLGGQGAYWGAVEHHLGVLAATAGRPDLAREHLERARAAHAAAGARLWLARTEAALRAASLVPVRARPRWSGRS